MILQLTPNTHPILHERVKKCSYDLDRSEISKILYGAKTVLAQELFLFLFC